MDDNIKYVTKRCLLTNVLSSCTLQMKCTPQGPLGNYKAQIGNSNKVLTTTTLHVRDCMTRNSRYYIIFQDGWGISDSILGLTCPSLPGIQFELRGFSVCGVCHR